MKRHERLANLAAFFDLMFEGCTIDDCLVIVAPERNRIHSCWRLGRGDYLVEAANAVIDTPGVYFKTNPMDHAAMTARAESLGRPVVGCQDEVRTVVGISLDVDAGKARKYPSREEVHAALDRMPLPPTLVINSNGQKGGFHVYWAYERPWRIETDEDREGACAIALRWQMELQELLGGRMDSTGNLDRVLRVPFVRRSKNGGLPDLDQMTGSRYAVDQFRLPPTAAQRRRAANLAKKKLEAEFFSAGSMSGKPITEYLQAHLITPQSMLVEMGYEEIGPATYRRPGSESRARTLKLSTEHSGINVFSGGDPFFDSIDDAGRSGRFYSAEAMYVAFFHGHDWRAAAKACTDTMATQALKGAGR